MNLLINGKEWIFEDGKLMEKLCKKAAMQYIFRLTPIIKLENTFLRQAIGTLLNRPCATATLIY